MSNKALCMLPVGDPTLPSSLHLCSTWQGTSGALNTLGLALLAGSSRFDEQRRLSLRACGSLPLMSPENDQSIRWPMAPRWQFDHSAFDPPPGSPFLAVGAQVIESWIVGFSGGGPSPFFLPEPLADLLASIPLLDRIGYPQGLGFGEEEAWLCADADAAAKELIERSYSRPTRRQAMRFPTLIGEQSAALLAGARYWSGPKLLEGVAYRHDESRWLVLCQDPALSRGPLRTGAWLPLSQVLASKVFMPREPDMMHQLHLAIDGGCTPTDMDDLFTMWRTTSKPADFFYGDAHMASVMERLSLERDAPRGSVRAATGMRL